MFKRSSLRQISAFFGASLAFFGGSSVAMARPCELHVWAAGWRTGPALNPQTLTPLERSAATNVLDAGQRLYEIDPKHLVSSLSLPDDTRVFVHTETQLLGKQAEKATTRLNPSDAPCYMDWTFRPDSMFGPPPTPNTNVIFRENHGQSSFYSVLKAYRAASAPYFTVKGIHRAHLPVISGPEERKHFVYDTVAASTQLIDHAAEKIKDNLKGRSLIEPSLVDSDN